MSKRDRQIRDPFEQNDRPEPIQRPDGTNYDKIEWTLVEDQMPPVEPRGPEPVADTDNEAPDTDGVTINFREIETDYQPESQVSGDSHVGEDLAAQPAPEGITLGFAESKVADHASPTTDATVGRALCNNEVIEGDVVGAAVGTVLPGAFTDQPEGDGYYRYELTNLQDDLQDG